jgi:hypothetical protein
MSGQLSASREREREQDGGSDVDVRNGVGGVRRRLVGSTFRIKESVGLDLLLAAMRGLVLGGGMTVRD